MRRIVPSVCISIVIFTLGVCSLSAAEAGADARERAQAILAETGVRGGIIVHLGCGDGKLTAALRAGDSFQVQGIDRDGANVQAARKHVQSLGMYGPVSVVKLTNAKRLPYIDNLINLVVAQDPDGIAMKEVMRVLAPGGVAYVRRDGAWEKTVKPWPKSIDEWTHFMHSASNNAVARDDVVGPPRHLQWLGSPRWSRHHDRMASLSAMVSAQGRVFYIMDEGSRISIQLPPRWTLIARDAFNGTVLWKRRIPKWQHHLWPLKSGPTHLARRLVAVDDRVYVTLGIDAPVSVLDAATGETIHVLEDTAGTEELIVSGPNVYALVNKGKYELADYKPAHNLGDQGRVARQFQWNEEPRQLMAFDTGSGRPLWQKKTVVAPLTMSSDGDRLFYHDGEKVVARDRANGEEEWSSEPVNRRQQIRFNFAPKLVIHDDVLLFAGGDREMHAFNTQSGKRMWSAPHARGGYQSPEDLLVSDGLVWSAPTTSGRDSGVWTGVDVRTGKVKKEFAPNVDTYWFHHRCYIAKATDNFILPSRTGIEFVDPDKSDWEIHHWVRGGCLYGVMPCNGLLYAPPHNCACYPEAKLYGLNALAPASNSSIGKLLEDAPLGKTADRLEKGPAYAATRYGSSQKDGAWPTYRGDNARSGSTAGTISEELSESWKTKLGGKLSAVTVAAGSLFVSAVDEHRILALDAATGEEEWQFIAGGRVDSPPTFHRGRIYFGSCDGYVYSLFADNGELAWRFRAAPVDLRHGVMEQLESVWPVHGSVLVTVDEEQGATVSFVAGRNVYLDGGLRFIKLNAYTGELLDEDVLDDKDPETGKNLQTRLKVLQMPVGLSDILSSDGKYRYMRSQPFDAEGKRIDLGPYSADFAGQGSVQRGETAHLFAPMGFLDDTYFHRAYWVYGRAFAGGHAGYYQAGKYAPSGRLLVHDDENVYGFCRKPQYYRWTTIIEHHLFRTGKEPPPQAAGGDSTVAANKGARRTAPAKTGMVHVDKSPSLDPTGKPLAVSVWVKAENPNGVVVAQGGPARGYALAIDKGRPLFVVREGEDRTVTASSGARVVGKWTHLCGVLTPDKHVQLYVDGKRADDAGEIPFITSDPVQALEIGGDDGGPVGAYKSPNLLKGTIDQVVVVHGNVNAEDVAALKSGDIQSLGEDAEVVLQLPFDDGSTKDASGKKNHGANGGAKAAQGHVAKALQFPGVGSRGNPRRSGSFVEHDWTSDIPVMVQAICKAGDVLFVCGPPDLMDEVESFAKIMAGDEKINDLLARQSAAFDGADGALLLAVDAETGKTLATHKLDELPVWDSLAAAGGKLYLTTKDGTVMCFEGK